MEQNANIKKVSTYSEEDYQRDYNEWKQSHRYCKKCLSPIVGEGEFCDFECRKEYYAEQRKLTEEVYWSLFED